MEWVVLADIAGPLPFSLIAVWAMNHRASNIKAFPQSNPQPAAALNTYWTESSGPTILAGDFNHNVSWDAGMPYAKQHARTLDAAKRAGLVSAYHHHFREAQGAESTPTLYWRGAGQKTFHIDYAFIPDEWLPRLRDVSVGSKQEWIDSRPSDRRSSRGGPGRHVADASFSTGRRVHRSCNTSLRSSITKSRSSSWG